MISLLYAAAAVGYLGRRPFASPFPRARACRCCDYGDFEALSVSVQVSLEDGSTELVTLDAAATPSVVAAELAAKHLLSPEQVAALESDLKMQWEDACQNAPPIYVGPMPENNVLSNCVAALELEDVGLVIEVADSVAVANGGRGLFLRCFGETEQVTLDEGVAVCGYASGEMRVAPDSEGGKTVAFALASLDSVVWFEQALHSVEDLMADESIDSIAGHVALRDEKTGDVIGIGLDPTWTGPRYFVPHDVQPQPLTIGDVGQMANDLAIGDLGLIVADEEEVDDGRDDEQQQDESTDEGLSASYEEVSGYSNILVLVFRLERDAADPCVLIPTRPITTLSKSITLVNDVPMEVG